MDDIQGIKMASTRATPLFATSAEETLLLTCTGEVLVCRHVDNGDVIHSFDFDNIANNPTSTSLDCSLNSNSLQASINTQQQQRRSLQKAWAECCEPERFCDLSTSDNNKNNASDNNIIINIKNLMCSSTW